MMKHGIANFKFPLSARKYEVKGENYGNVTVCTLIQLLKFRKSLLFPPLWVGEKRDISFILYKVCHNTAHEICLQNNIYVVRKVNEPYTEWRLIKFSKKKDP
jgi:hypothetical protein